ncbi:endonuclease/exonuclease/phosphatase family protein [Paenibacillus thalictri]|uniref:Endonuclease n=1 Tax=Paenibacillus thalictri TaxID=2527873 RepID=A0A4Q9DXN9_9BACL|nr:endonuclease/exonuclease/phosphatase family protein [Paenibacillus thalictri]TBL80558.1 endonuclease [Paenibacillus thalictri]
MNTEGNKQSVNVLSYNIHHGVGEDGKLDLARIAGVIKQAGAEIIALQEVDKHWSERSQYADQAQTLAELLDMHCVFAANLDRAPAEGRTQRRQYGLALLSKYPIAASSHHALPKLEEDSEQRGLLQATIQVGAATVHVYSVHLALSVEERLLQNQKIVEIAQGQSGSHIFMGDFNAGPKTTEMKPMFEHYAEAFQGREDAYTFPVTQPSIQGDYIFFSKNMEAVRSEIIDTIASDHLPPTAVLQF